MATKDRLCQSQSQGIVFLSTIQKKQRNTRCIRLFQTDLRDLILFVITPFQQMLKIKYSSTENIKIQRKIVRLRLLHSICKLITYECFSVSNKYPLTQSSTAFNLLLISMSQKLQHVATALHISPVKALKLTEQHINTKNT